MQLSASIIRELSSIGLALLFVFSAAPTLARDSFSEYSAHVRLKSSSFEIDGFSRSKGRGGIILYTCEADWCAKGSTISYKRQPRTTPYTEAEFQKHIGAVRFDLFRAGSDVLENVDLGGCDYVPAATVTTGDCILTLKPKVGATLNHRSYFSGFIAMQNRLYTTASSATSIGAARSNSELLLVTLLHVAHGQ